MNNVLSRCQRLLDQADVTNAAALLKTAAEHGDPLATRELALWYLTGQIISRDLRRSRELFERASALGDHYSQAVTRAFLAGGIGGETDWPGAISLLREAAGTDAEARAQLELIDQMELGPSGEAPNSYDHRPLSSSPEIIIFPSFFSHAECEYMIELASPLLRPSFVIDPFTGQQVPNVIRTSDGAAFPFVDENPAVHALNRRIAAASATDVRAGEPLQVLRYASGQQYREHSDALPEVSPSQQRVLTFLVYLNEDYEGGETYFPALELKVRGRLGDGLLFRNASPAGAPEPLARHAGLPVTSGTKHLASRWIRAAPLVL